MTIYTRKGDHGKTSLPAKNRKLLKSDPRICALGTLDELNAHLGLIASLLGLEKDSETKEIIESLQKDIFEISSEIVGLNEASSSVEGRGFLFRGNKGTEKIEKLIEGFLRDLPPLGRFIFPGGTVLAAEIHIARAVCRRAEREIVRLGKVNSGILSYVNRLSDFLFVLARWVNWKKGVSEKKW